MVPKWFWLQRLKEELLSCEYLTVIVNIFEKYAGKKANELLYGSAWFFWRGCSA